jgi:hypothetical protein
VVTELVWFQPKAFHPPMDLHPGLAHGAGNRADVAVVLGQ